MISPSALVRLSTAATGSKDVLGTERRILPSLRSGAAAPTTRRDAIIGMLTSGADPVPRHRAGGHALGPRGRRFSYDRPYLLGKLKVALGGRVAEQLVLDDITTGAQNDIKQSTSLASLTRWCR